MTAQTLKRRTIALTLLTAAFTTAVLEFVVMWGL